MDWKIELIALPVTDVDRAKNFYTSIGFNADHDHTPTPDIRFVQLTPPVRATRRRGRGGVAGRRHGLGAIHVLRGPGRQQVGRSRTPEVAVTQKE